ncbi:MAG: DnaJ domain-containing protein [Azonexus sp.]|nr:DnaJ domain-containing protein [Azonexus sp.]
MITEKDPMKDFYGLLGVSADATAEIIKSAYRKKAAQFHPDRNPEPDAAAKFRAVQEAYETLTDVDRRKAYDETRRTSLIDDPIIVAREIWSNYLGNIQK